MKEVNNPPYLMLNHDGKAEFKLQKRFSGPNPKLPFQLDDLRWLRILSTVIFNFSERLILVFFITFQPLKCATLHSFSRCKR